MHPPPVSGGYSPYAAGASLPHPAAPASELDRINAAWLAFRQGRASFADTVAAYRAAGLTEHQATVTLAVAIAGQQPNAARLWWRRGPAKRRPPVWR